MESPPTRRVCPQGSPNAACYGMGTLWDCPGKQQQHTTTRCGRCTPSHASLLYSDKCHLIIHEAVSWRMNRCVAEFFVKIMKF